ncbi:hypothetical protein QN386_02020 [Pseudomonas sp. CCI3.2]|uniref:hypothetical protein n=1 Tax=unclassified Pseudomonas TaxID=196821 RepID=UPI002AC98496|nr:MULTISPECIES: hypothetical protein [unclassified Pseudomonas]MEB0076094.1 hypothetical protein [Pseudomonas sp. MH10out]MEB0090800.1 hypothetical protein [Pseudomonas sp. CCI4.2]MEB0100106.1 hypothetical protein [Pseudomonas sp. CCI3.2]MEB0132049.1 hypothetical protein [Pseudomonas sp. CCI2.4]MEB0156153.1 hypothetical protein [Pseudomonas sp. AH2 (2023)]
MTAQIECFLAHGGIIFQAPPPTYSFRPIAPPAQGGEAADLKYQSARQAAAEKQAFVEQIRGMSKTMTQRAIVEQTGVARRILFAMGQKHGFAFRFERECQPRPAGARTDRSQDAARVERIKDFKEIGLTRAQAARQLEVNDKLFIRLITEYDIDYPKYVSNPL